MSVINTIRRFTLATMKLCGATRHINPAFSFTCIITLNLKNQHCSGRNIQYPTKQTGYFLISRLVDTKSPNLLISIYQVITLSMIACCSELLLRKYGWFLYFHVPSGVSKQRNIVELLQKVFGKPMPNEWG